MRKLFFVILAIVTISAITTVFAFKTMRLSYVYVPYPTGPTDACTKLLLSYTTLPNGNTPILRTASPIPVTVGCKVISIYPDNEEGVVPE